MPVKPLRETHLQFRLLLDGSERIKTARHHESPMMLRAPQSRAVEREKNERCDPLQPIPLTYCAVRNRESTPPGPIGTVNRRLHFGQRPS